MEESELKKIHLACPLRTREDCALAIAYVSSVRPIYPRRVREAGSDITGKPEYDVLERIDLSLERVRPVAGRSVREDAGFIVVDTGTWKVCSSFVSRNGKPLNDIIRSAIPPGGK